MEKYGVSLLPAEEDYLDELFSHLRPESIGAAYQKAYENKNGAEMFRLAASYYRERPDTKATQIGGKFGYSIKNADRAVVGSVTSVNIPWDFPNGEIDFHFNPTKLHPPVNHEWLWQLNRHPFWADMAGAYLDTGDEKYAKGFSAQIRKWVREVPLPTPWNVPDSAWRTIECGIRLGGCWPRCFEVFRRSESFDDLTLLLMLAAMYKQARHLADHPTGQNWLMMEMHGTYTFGALYPEFDDAEEMRGMAGRLLADELEKQILPDGMQNELSPDYHLVVYNCASRVYQLALDFGFEGEIPPIYPKLLKKAAKAYYEISTPALCQPRTNDCYTLMTNRVLVNAQSLFPKARSYRYFLTERKAGTPPKGKTPSRFLPYAGIVAMRQDWSADAVYLSFDVGPLGMAHQHQDKLNIQLYRGSEELIFDDGGGQYEISPMRSYALSAADHNTVLVDGLPQHRNGPKKSEKPIDCSWETNDVFDYACAVYDDTFGKEQLAKPATHKREVRYCRPGFFVVKDTLKSSDGNAHRYELLFHTEALKLERVEKYEGALRTDFGRNYDLLLLPVCQKGDVPETVETASGQTEPCIRGWYVGRNESNVHPATTISRIAEGCEDHVFTTLLFPIKRGDKLPEVTKNGDRLTVLFEEKTYELDLSALDR